MLKTTLTIRKKPYTFRLNESTADFLDRGGRNKTAVVENGVQLIIELEMITLAYAINGYLGMLDEEEKIKTLAAIKDSNAFFHAGIEKDIHIPCNSGQMNLPLHFLSRLVRNETLSFLFVKLLDDRVYYFSIHSIIPVYASVTKHYSDKDWENLISLLE